MKEIILLTNNGRLIGIATSNKQKDMLAKSFIFSGKGTRVEFTYIKVNTLENPISICHAPNNTIIAEPNNNA